MNPASSFVRAAMLCVAAGLLGGCGQLTVRVDVLNPDHVQQEVADLQLRKLHRDILSAQPGDFARAVEREFRRYRDQMIALLGSYEAAAAKAPQVERSTVQGWKNLRESLTRGSARDRAQKVGEDLEIAARAIRDSRLAWNQDNAPPADLRLKLEAFRAARKRLVTANQIELTRLDSEVRDYKIELERLQAASAAARAVSGAVSAPATAAATPAQAADAAREIARTAPQMTNAQAAVRSVIENSSIAATEYAYAVARSSDHLWAPDFNRAMGHGIFGNVDIVIRLNATADFSVKGLLFDASKVAQVASKVVTQSLLLGAQLAGVPVSTSNAGGGADALGSASAALANADRDLAARQALLESQRNALRALARAIISTGTTLETGSLQNEPDTKAERVAAHQAITDTLNALKPALSLQELR